MQKFSQLWHNPLLLRVYLPILILSLWRSIFTPILPLYATELGGAYWQVGVLLGASEFGQLLGNLPSGYLLSRFGSRRALMLGAGTAVFASVALFWTPTITLAFIFRFISGFGLALYNITIHLYLTEMVRQNNRGKAIAGYGGVNRIGAFIGPAIGGIIGDSFGLRAPFLFSALLGVVLVGTLAFSFRHAVVEQPSRKASYNMLRVLQNHRHILTAAGAGVLFAQTIRAGRRVIIPLFGAEVIGLDVQAIGFIISIAAGVDMVLFPVAGVMMDRMGRKWSIVPSFLIQGIGMAFIPFTAGFSTLLAAACVIGFGNGLGSGTMMTLGADLSTTENRSAFLATWRFIGDSGFALGPNVVGVIADLFMLGTAVFVIAAAGLMAAMVFGLFVPETLQRG